MENENLVSENLNEIIQKCELCKKDIHSIDDYKKVTESRVRNRNIIFSSIEKSISYESIMCLGCLDSIKEDYGNENKEIFKFPLLITSLYLWYEVYKDWTQYAKFNTAYFFTSLTLNILVWSRIWKFSRKLAIALVISPALFLLLLQWLMKVYFFKI